MKTLSYAQLTDRGRVRSGNEDSCRASVPEDPSLLERKGAFFALADGLGGLADGEVASRMAVDACVGSFEGLKEFPGTGWLAETVAEANRRIWAENAKKPPEARMGTTLTLGLFHGDRLFIAHVGDCRLYRIRDGRTERLTQDHALDRYTLTRSVGLEPAVVPDVTETDVQKGDAYVACSDGLHGVVEDAEIGSAASALPPADAARRLVDLANERGGPDNITVQIIWIS